MIRVLLAIILIYPFLSGCATFNSRSELNEIRERVVVIEEDRKQIELKFQVHEYFIKQLMEENSIMKRKLKNHPI